MEPAENGLFQSQIVNRRWLRFSHHIRPHFSITHVPAASYAISKMASFGKNALERHSFRWLRRLAAPSCRAETR
jgi:hypothetical protein